MNRQILFLLFTSMHILLHISLHAAEVKISTATKQEFTLEMERAALVGDLKSIHELLKDHVDINAQNADSNTMLMLAAHNNHIHVVNALLHANAKIDIRNKTGETALYIAAGNGNDRALVVGALIKSHADVNAQNDFGRTPLEHATNGIDINNRIHIINALIKAGVDPNMTNKIGWTPLMYAAGHSPKEIIITLLNAGSNPHIVSHDAQIVRNRVFEQNNEKEDLIKQYIATYAEKTFYTELERFQPRLLEDPEIQEALADYERRYIQHKKDVAEIIEASIEPMHFPPVLANIAAEYVVEHAPSDSAKASTDRAKNKDATSWCAIT